jgi:lipopolysaccharide/colanic/teichoic acid biosynthesis glycosyltransferase
VLVASVLPFAVAGLLTPALTSLDLFFVSFGGSVAGVTLGYWFLRSLDGYPGTRADFAVLPVLTTCFAAVFAAFFLLRLEYSRPLLLLGWLLSLVWYYGVHRLIARHTRRRFAIVPFGRAESLRDIAGAEWTVLARPERPPGCDGIAADFHIDLAPEWEEFMAECALRDTPVFHYKQLRESLTGQVEIGHLSENALGSLIPNNSFLTIKLLVDVAAAAALGLLLLPALVVVALLVRLDSPGPAIFRQERVGYRGQHFRVWKFRTMHTRAPVSDEAARAEAITADHDRRITRVGRLLRRTRIDELPQLWNVVRGEMSLIGPRPEAEVLSRWYREEIPFYRYRHIVRPGITGWAQVMQGHVVSLEDVLKKLNYDFFYISNFGFWLDVLIVVKTIRTMLTGSGAR